MSRCYSCNCILTPQEMARKFKNSGTYTEMCSSCLKTISSDVETTEGNYPKEKEISSDEDYENFD